VAYQTAYLKAHYPAEFMAANLTNNLNDVDEISSLVTDCKRMGINVLGPDINESDAHFTVNAKGEIRFGLGAIKGVGQAAVEDIVKERETGGNFASILDFMQRLNPRTCNKKVMEALALAGSFDAIGDVHRAQFFVEADGSIFLEKLLRYASNYQANKDSKQISMFGEATEDIQDLGLSFPSCTPWTTMQKLNKEREVTGFYISGHPLDDYRLEINNFCKHSLNDLEESGAIKRLLNSTFNLAGMIVDASTGVGKNGQSYAKIALEDFQGKKEFMLWGENCMKFRHFCESNTLVMLTVKSELMYGRTGKTDDDYRLSIQNIQLLENIMKEKTRHITITLSNGYVDDHLISSIEKLITDNHHPKGASIRFNVFDLEQTMNVYLNSPERVDVVPFCQQLRKLLNDDGLIMLES
jgi:DNA polymerase-3 subunit alpha